MSPTPRPVPSQDEAHLLGVVGSELLHLADDPSLWADYRQLIARARVLAEAKVSALPPEPDRDPS